MRTKDNEWKDSDLAVLKESTGNYSISEIAEMLGRSVSSVKNKMRTLSLQIDQQDRTTARAVIQQCRKEAAIEQAKLIAKEIVELEDERAEIDGELARLNRELNDLINQINEAAA